MKYLFQPSTLKFLGIDGEFAEAECRALLCDTFVSKFLRKHSETVRLTEDSALACVSAYAVSYLAYRLVGNLGWDVWDIDFGSTFGGALNTLQSFSMPRVEAERILGEVNRKIIKITTDSGNWYEVIMMSFNPELTQSVDTQLRMEQENV